MRYWKRIVLALLLSAQSAWAQQGSGSKMEFLLEGGSILPDQIDGVSEILPAWGLGVGLATTPAKAYLLEFINATSEGVQLYNVALSARADFDVSSLKGIVSGGADLVGLERPGHEGRNYYGGAHFGGGMMALISKGLYARMNMKFNLNPGVSMFIGFGLLYRPSEDN